MVYFSFVLFFIMVGVLILLERKGNGKSTTLSFELRISHCNKVKNIIYRIRISLASTDRKSVV